LNHDVDPGSGAVVPSRLNGALIAVLRVGVALLWIANVSWKDPPGFATLRQFTRDAVEHPVFPPYSWLVDHLILPNFTFFAWVVLLVESALGAFLLIGLATRFWALVGMAQTVAISLAVLNTPGEWVWSYVLMLLAHVALFATAAGRYGGLDGLLRPGWLASPDSRTRLLVMAS
jgi:thiosulfate dehydrogenase [quinone] large subunit